MKTRPAGMPDKLKREHVVLICKTCWSAETRSLTGTVANYKALEAWMIQWTEQHTQLGHDTESIMGMYPNGVGT